MTDLHYYHVPYTEYRRNIIVKKKAFTIPPRAGEKRKYQRSQNKPMTNKSYEKEDENKICLILHLPILFCKHKSDSVNVVV